MKALVEESKAKSEHSLSSSSESQKEVASDTSQQFEIEDKKQQCRKRVQTLSCERVSDSMYKHHQVYLVYVYMEKMDKLIKSHRPVW